MDDLQSANIYKPVIRSDGMVLLQAQKMMPLRYLNIRALFIPGPVFPANAIAANE